MAILKTCCCGKSVRRGSFFSGFFTLAFYTVVVTTGTFHVNTAFYSPVLLVFSLLMVVFAGLCVLTSVLLLVGLCVDSRMMLLPWIFSVSMTTVLDVILSFYLFSEAEVTSLLGILFATDLIICALNVYSILCVISQYQEYLAGRGSVNHCRSTQPVSSVRFCPSPATAVQLVPKVTLRITESTSTSEFQVVPCSLTSSLNQNSSEMSSMSVSEDYSSMNDSAQKVTDQRRTNKATVVSCSTSGKWHIVSKSPLRLGRLVKWGKSSTECLDDFDEEDPLLRLDRFMRNSLKDKKSNSAVLLKKLPPPPRETENVKKLSKSGKSMTCPSGFASSSDSDVTPPTSERLSDSS